MRKQNFNRRLRRREPSSLNLAQLELVCKLSSCFSVTFVQISVKSFLIRYKLKAGQGLVTIMQLVYRSVSFSNL